MGIHVLLTTDPDQIQAEAWRRVYRESWQVLKAYADEPLNTAWREFRGEKVPMYVRDLEHVGSDGSGWRVCGDARSKLTGESFVFPERHGRARADAPASADLLVRAAHEASIGGARVFSEKTQGRPYHVLVLAVATLVENRFPGAALAHGELSIRDGQDACDLLFRALGEQMLPPVVLDPARLRERLRPSLGAEASEKAAEELHPDQGNALGADLLTILRERPNSRILDELEDAVTCRDVAELSPTMRKLIADAAGSLGDIVRRLEMDEEVSSRGGFGDRNVLLRRIAIATRANGFILTEDAWSAIESETLDSLRFLSVVAFAKADELHPRLLSRAWFESEALRRFGLAQWSVSGR